MIKKAGIALFIIVATLFNILVTAICFAILLLLFSVLAVPHISDQAAFIGSLLLLAVSFGLSFLVYQRALKLYLKKRPLVF